MTRPPGPTRPAAIPHIPEAVILDLDGTLVDSAPDLADAANALLARHGLPPLDPATVRGFIGEGVGRLVERSFAHQGRPLEPAALEAATVAFLAIYGEAPARHTRPYPGVAAALQELTRAGIRLGVCTNKPEAISRRILETLDLARFFAAIIGGDSGPERKPHPRPLLAALEKLNARPETSLLVGDSATDLATGRAAGVPVILVEGGYSATPVDELGADAVIASLEELIPRRTVLPGPLRSVGGGGDGNGRG